MNTKDYMRSAITAANRLRTELGRRIEGPHTVAPHAAMYGGTVSVHLSGDQALMLAEMVKQNKSPARMEWMAEFFIHSAMDGCGDIVVGHWTGVDEQCPQKWEARTENIDRGLNGLLAAAYDHMEVCGK